MTERRRSSRLMSECLDTRRFNTLYEITYSTLLVFPESMCLCQLNSIEPPWYGPVCPVVWRGGVARRPPIPINLQMKLQGLVFSSSQSLQPQITPHPKNRLPLKRLQACSRSTALTNRIAAARCRRVWIPVLTDRLRRKKARVPVPGRTNDRLEVMPGRPADCPPRQSTVGDQRRRVAVATRPVSNFEISTYDSLNGLKQFLHGCPIAGSKI
jgi:hypothetical protein